MKRKTQKEELKFNNVSRKKCPVCKINLLTELLHNSEVDYCPKCLGIWFDEGELDFAKDNREEMFRWVDVDLWEDRSKFKISYGYRLCPTCRMPLYEIYYGNSKIVVDICSVCHGVWLERNEFKKIIEYLKKESAYGVISRYAKKIFKEMGGVFHGPKNLREEILDVILVLKMFGYKFSAQHPVLSQIFLEILN